MYGRGFEVNGYLVGLKLYLLVVYLALAIEVGITILIPYHGVLGLIDDGSLQVVTLLSNRISWD
jgi:hypothetical protein